MLANQVKLPEVQPKPEPSNIREVKASEGRKGERDFDRIMQDGRKEQTRTRDNGSQETRAKRQTSGNDRPDNSHDERGKSDDTVATEETKLANSHSDKPAKAEHDCEHDAKAQQTSSKKLTIDGDKLAATADAQQAELEASEQTETSKWLDTILSIANTDNKEAEVDTDASVASSQVLKLDTVEQGLAELGIELDLSEFNGEGEITLEQLQQLLPEQEFNALLAQMNLDADGKGDTELTPEQEFEQLLAQVSGNNQETQTKSSVDVNTVAKAIEQVQQQSSLQPVSVAQVSETRAELEADVAKPSSLLSATQATGGANGQVEFSQKPAAQTISELLAPTTKVVDLSSGAANAETNKLGALGQSEAANGNTEAKQEMDKAAMDAALQQASSKEQSEVKSTNSLFNQLGLDEVKTSEVVEKAEKVNVAGVTLDKTLQMPKLEQMSQSRNEVLIRENILFNKQELAAQMQTQVGLMLAKNMKSVDMRLDPPELGSMQVKLSIQNDQASVSFVVSNQQTKEALENSFPRLKELLEQQGLELADSDVQQQQSQTGQAQDDDEDVRKNGLNSEVEEVDNELEQQQQMINRAINSPWNVSYYA